MFPVKLTDPLTAILYITADKEHIVELQHVIHVKEVVEGETFRIFYSISGYVFPSSSKI